MRRYPRCRVITGSPRYRSPGNRPLRFTPKQEGILPTVTCRIPRNLTKFFRGFVAMFAISIQLLSTFVDATFKHEILEDAVISRLNKLYDRNECIPISDEGMNKFIADYAQDFTQSCDLSEESKLFIKEILQQQGLRLARDAVEQIIKTRNVSEQLISHYSQSASYMGLFIEDYKADLEELLGKAFSVEYTTHIKNELVFHRDITLLETGIRSEFRQKPVPRGTSPSAEEEYITQALGPGCEITDDHKRFIDDLFEKMYQERFDKLTGAVERLFYQQSEQEHIMKRNAQDFILAHKELEMIIKQIQFPDAHKIVQTVLDEIRNIEHAVSEILDVKNESLPMPTDHVGQSMFIYEKDNLEIFLEALGVNYLRRQHYALIQDVMSSMFYRDRYRCEEIAGESEERKDYYRGKRGRSRDRGEKKSLTSVPDDTNRRLVPGSDTGNSERTGPAASACPVSNSPKPGEAGSAQTTPSPAPVATPSTFPKVATKKDRTGRHFTNGVGKFVKVHGKSYSIRIGDSVKVDGKKGKLVWFGDFNFGFSKENPKMIPAIGIKVRKQKGQYSGEIYPLGSFRKIKLPFDCGDKQGIIIPQNLEKAGSDKSSRKMQKSRHKTITEQPRYSFVKIKTKVKKSTGTSKKRRTYGPAGHDVCRDKRKPSRFR